MQSENLMAKMQTELQKEREEKLNLQKQNQQMRVDLDSQMAKLKGMSESTHITAQTMELQELGVQNQELKRELVQLKNRYEKLQIQVRQDQEAQWLKLATEREQYQKQFSQLEKDYGLMEEKFMLSCCKIMLLAGENMRLKVY